MPTKVEKDSITGTETTGHEWDGIKELNTPLPRWWLYVFYASIAVSVVYWILYPAIPGLSGYTRGLLGYDQRAALHQQIGQAQAAQAAFLGRIDQTPTEEIGRDPDLLRFAMAGGASAFADNCAPCHGLGGAGRPGGYPVLADDDWLWGGQLADLEASIRHGIRNQDDAAARISEMPAFGAGILTRAQIADVTQFVLSLTGGATDQEAVPRGHEIYAANCASCHGVNGEGGREFGAPRLNDGIWLYGSDGTSIAAQIARPRHGVMPPWDERLSPTTIRMLAVYVHSLGGGE